MHNERGPFSRLTLNFNFPARILDDSFHHKQADARSFHMVVKSPEHAKYNVLITEVHPQTVILNPNYNKWVIVFAGHPDRKSTRLNSSHVKISYAVFCLKKKRTT